MKPIPVLFAAAGLMVATGTVSAECFDAFPQSTDGRFARNGDGTITDVLSGLVWKKCSEGQEVEGSGCSGTPNSYTWGEALRHAESAEFAGEEDWRLPNVKELASIVDLACADPAVDPVIWPDTRSDIYWTSTPVAGQGDSAWWVNFTVGSDGFSPPAGGEVPKEATYHVRLVRGGTVE